MVNVKNSYLIFKMELSELYKLVTMEQKRGTKGLKSQGYLLFHSFVAPLTLYVLFSYCGQTE